MMASATAQVPTASGSRYLQQLCKHWSHKFETAFDAQQGTIALPMGTATLVAAPESLNVTVSTDDAEKLDKLKEVVASHLDRFAFREAPLSFDWQ
ncbi:DUF2218 domain-containing protein [Sphingobium sp. H39-3-25]|uniref:DUF2218 domain-containing protein n=1 Tax=Sphingobium arseniciresistens TaxID=3030834 RepID=UPI0023BA399C|nr:DUF2218 domain-containing protein [Sphingobium arseniciresistens]